MPNTYKKGSKVSWKWGKGRIKGIIEEVYLEQVEKQIKNSSIKRNGSKENPAYFIKKEDKDVYVLKLHFELTSEDV